MTRRLEHAETRFYVPCVVCGVELDQVAAGDPAVCVECEEPADRPCVTCAAVGVFRWSTTCRRIGHHARTAG